MDRNPVMEIRDEAIPLSVIQDLHNLCVTNNWAMEDAITYHRNTLVPNGYAPNSFRSNIPESYLDKLRSLVGTYLSLMQRRCSPTWLQNSSESMDMKQRDITWKQWQGGMKLLMGKD